MYLDSHMQRKDKEEDEEKESDLYLILYTGVDSEWIKDLEIGAESIKHSVENIGRTLQDMNLRSVFEYFIPSQR